MQTQAVIFSAPKKDYKSIWWEDGGGWSYGRGGAFRFAVADGATEAYLSRHWVNQLIESFLAPGSHDTPPGPEIERESLRAWLEQMQAEWPSKVPHTTDPIDLRKMREGSLATFVGCQIDGLNSKTPRWKAFSAGDAVMFHVRGDQMQRHVPNVTAADFGTTPAGFSTLPDRLASVVKQFEFSGDTLQTGDVLYGASDAFAKWMLTWVDKDPETLWRALAALADPDDFDRLVAEQRQTKSMKDDDVTLLRVRMVSRLPNSLVVWQ